jgi:hypothetical protein
LLGLVPSCNDELGRVTLYGPGEVGTTSRLDAPATITFKTNLEVEGPADLSAADGDFRYDIEALQEGKVVASTECDPLKVGPSFVQSRRASSTRIGSHRHSITDAPVTGCALKVPSAGTTTIRVRLEQLRSSKMHLLHLELIAGR